MFHPQPGDALEQGAGTAPGDLPLADVEKRIAVQRQQFRHDNTIQPLAPSPDTPVEVWASSGDELPVERAEVIYSTDHTNSSAWTSLEMEPVTIDWDPRASYLTRWRAVIPPHPEGTVVRYRIGGWLAGHDSREDPDLLAHDGQGFWFRYPGKDGISTFAYRVEAPADPLPEWVRDAVIYQIFLDRFHPGTPDGAFPQGLDPVGIHGGTLKGVRRALPYLEDLGITCLWLSPLNPAPSYHRYDATDYYSVDPVLGTIEDLRAMIDDAHRRGMRVILDWVPSHSSVDHPAFRAAQADPAAFSANWFTFEERPNRYRCFLGVIPSLPSFNTEDPGAREYLIGSAVQWVRDYGIDGFRIDHAMGPSMDFWVQLRTDLQAVKPDVFTVGEVTDTPDSLRRYRNRLDAVLDFPLTRALRLTFGRGSWDLARFDTFLRDYERYMSSGPGRVSFLDNHDMNRFLYEAGGNVNRLKLAALCQFTLAGPPTIYYGTEIGLSQEMGMEESGFGGDVLVRQDMPWDQSVWNADLLDFYRQLVRLRRSQPALRRGTRHTIQLDAGVGTYTYRRSLPEDGSFSTGDLASAFNVGTGERQIPLPPGEWTALLSTEGSPRLNGGTVTLAPMTGAVLRLVDASTKGDFNQAVARSIWAASQSVMSAAGSGRLKW